MGRKKKVMTTTQANGSNISSKLPPGYLLKCISVFFPICPKSIFPRGSNANLSNSQDTSVLTHSFKWQEPAKEAQTPQQVDRIGFGSGRLASNELKAEQ